MSKRHEAAKGFEKGQAGERPECCTDEHIEYLDVLRETGLCNMFGARPYLMSSFPELSAEQAGVVLGYWMKSFGKRHAKA